MRGVILAGGNGTRMLPLTKVVNKVLLPINHKPMLQHCVEKMVEADITDILIVTGGEHLGGIAEFLGSGKDFSCDFTYRVQDRAGGIAEALGLAEGFVGHDDFCVLLGDNIFKDSLSDMRAEYTKGTFDCMLVLKEVSDPQRFGVAEVEFQCRESKTKAEDVEVRHEAPRIRVEGGEQLKAIRASLCGGSGSGILSVVGIDEKPVSPKSSFAVTGIYFYDCFVFDFVKQLTPSERGELEITDVNNFYVKSGNAGCYEMKGWWSDAGTLESYACANEWMRMEERKCAE